MPIKDLCSVQAPTLRVGTSNDAYLLNYSDAQLSLRHPDYADSGLFIGCKGRSVDMRSCGAQFSVSNREVMMGACPWGQTSVAVISVNAKNAAPIITLDSNPGVNYRSKVGTINLAACGIGIHAGGDATIYSCNDIYLLQGRNSIHLSKYSNCINISFDSLSLQGIGDNGTIMLWGTTDLAAPQNGSVTITSPKFFVRCYSTYILEANSSGLFLCRSLSTSDLSNSTNAHQAATISDVKTLIGQGGGSGGSAGSSLSGDVVTITGTQRVGIESGSSGGWVNICASGIRLRQNDSGDPGSYMTLKSHILTLDVDSIEAVGRGTSIFSARNAGLFLCRSLSTSDLSNSTNAHQAATISDVKTLIGQGGGGTGRLADKTIIYNDAEASGPNLVLDPTQGMYLESKTTNVPVAGYYWNDSDDGLFMGGRSIELCSSNATILMSNNSVGIGVGTGTNFAFYTDGTRTNILAPDLICLNSVAIRLSAVCGVFIDSPFDASKLDTCSHLVTTVSMVHCLAAQSVVSKVPKESRTLAGTSNASLNWLQLDERRVPAGVLHSISIPCRTDSSSGVAAAAYYLSIWEQDATNSTNYVFIGASISAVRQTINATSTWRFRDIELSGRSIRIDVTSVATAWQTDKWFGVRMAAGEDGEASFGNGNGRIYQVVDMTFDVTALVEKFAPESHVRDTIMHTTEATHNWLTAAQSGTQALTAPSLLIKGTSGSNLLSLRGNVTNVTATGPAMTFTVPRFWVNGDYPVLYSTNPNTGVTKTWFGATQDAASLAPLGLTAPGVYAGDASLPLYLRGSELYWNGEVLNSSGGGGSSGGGFPVQPIQWIIGGRNLTTATAAAFYVYRGFLNPTGTGNTDTITLGIKVRTPDGDALSIINWGYLAPEGRITTEPSANTPDMASVDEFTFTGFIHDFSILYFYVNAIRLPTSSSSAKPPCRYEGAVVAYMNPFADGEIHVTKIL